MSRSIRRTALLIACALLPAANAFAVLPAPQNAIVPCAIVLVGHDNGGTVTDPYGEFTVTMKDNLLMPMPGVTITVDFGNCCPDVKLSNTQLGAGVSHAVNSSKVSAVTDNSGVATFRIEGATSGSLSPLTRREGCALITATVFGSISILLTNGIDHPTVLVATPDLAGTVGTPGVDITDLAVWLSDKNAYVSSTANYRQRSDLDFHLPVFNCSEVFNPSSGFGVNVGDLGQWLMLKNGGRSFSNGPFSPGCP